MNTYDKIMNPVTTAKIHASRLAPEGLYRWSELKPILPCGREKWRLLVNAGKAPKAVKLGARCTAWRGADVLEWLRDPEGYEAK